MKKMRKISAAILAGVMALSCATVSAHELTAEQKKDLKDFQIMVGDANGEMNFDQVSTRAVIVKMICVAGGIDTTKHTAQFPDVSEDHWAYDYICMAKELGIVNGDENGLFNPEQSVTTEEAVKMLVSLLGYAPRAEITGGYPIGYMSTASQLGITHDLALVSDSAVLRCDLGEMFWRALDIPIMQVKNQGCDDEEFIVADGNGDVPLETLRTNLLKK